MAKKLEVVYGWREDRRPREWFHHLHWIRLGDRKDFRTGIAIWMTRQEAELANRKLYPRAGLKWVDAGESPRWGI